MNDFLIRSADELFVVRGTDRYGESFQWATHDRAEATTWAAGVIRRKGTANIDRHVYHSGKATFVFSETLTSWREVSQ